MVASKQIEKIIFHAALELEDLELRAVFLDQACGGNAALRTEMEELLAVHPSAREFFEASPLQLLADTQQPKTEVVSESPSAATSSEMVNLLIGRYRLWHRLGEGGCGAVYLAEQERPVRRRVALKIIRLGMDTARVIARFEAERQALALMDHPNIAHVLDAGATESGRPYFVMELVEGAKITDYCNQNNLDIQQRLDLFIQICHAIQHAHQKGIIHRDIKPSNIMVTVCDGRPVPKVIDFGIAKATQGSLTEQTQYTAYDQFVGTPAYMSPEQANMSGLDVDTRSDIYSLGVLLYELLTGRTPFDSKDLVKGGMDELRRTLREREPRLPSTVLTTLGHTELRLVATQHHTEPPRLISTVRGDLDWIVMKALEKDRARRYETANGLAMDVRRYLENEPVIARPPSTFYRLQKLIRRNIGFFVAAGAVTLALVAGIGVSTLMFLKERAARKEQERLRLEQVRLHHAENDRQKLAQAMICFSQGRLAEADQKVEGVAASEVTYPYAHMFRVLGGWNAGHNRWKTAGVQLAKVIQITDPNLGERTLDFLRYGPLLVESGDMTGYNGFRFWAISQVISTPDAESYERVVKVCALMPCDAELIKKLQPLANPAEASFANQQEPFDHMAMAWRALSLAMLKYRQGDFAGSEGMCVRALSLNSSNDIMVASINIVLAMDLFQLGRKDEARSEFNRASAVIESHVIASENDVEGYWFDWVIGQILSRQARELISPS